MDYEAKKDFYILFITRSLRLFSYGSLAVALFSYLKEIGFTEQNIGVLMSSILIGDLVITMILTTSADRFGRRRTLAIGALLKLFTGLSFVFSNNFWVLVISGIIGVISTTGGEIGPFLAIEQASLTQLKQNISHGEIATLFGWYNLFGYLSQALGALFGGALITVLQQKFDFGREEAYRAVLISYSFWGFVKWMLYNQLSQRIETRKLREKNVEPDKTIIFGIKKKKTLKTLITLSLLFAVDAFAGGFVMQTFLSDWFEERWELNAASLGTMLMVTNIVSGVSGIVASKLVNLIGAIQTMVITHLPSNVLLMLIPVMPTQITSVLMLISRSCISQMDVPARQVYVNMVVDSDERSAAGGITNIARSLGLSTSPLLLGYLINGGVNSNTFSYPFFIAGALKIFYDLAVCFCYIGSKKDDKDDGKKPVQMVELKQEKSSEDFVGVQIEQTKESDDKQ